MQNFDYKWKKKKLIQKCAHIEGLYKPALPTKKFLAPPLLSSITIPTPSNYLAYNVGVFAL
jgi:hypothetical protein